jgi:hypothetical protein
MSTFKVKQMHFVRQTCVQKHSSKNLVCTLHLSERCTQDFSHSVACKLFCPRHNHISPPLQIPIKRANPPPADSQCHTPSPMSRRSEPERRCCRRPAPSRSRGPPQHPQGPHAEAWGGTVAPPTRTPAMQPSVSRTSESGLEPRQLENYWHEQPAAKQRPADSDFTCGGLGASSPGPEAVRFRGSRLRVGPRRLGMPRARGRLAYFRRPRGRHGGRRQAHAGLAEHLYYSRKTCLRR